MHLKVDMYKVVKDLDNKKNTVAIELYDTRLGGFKVVSVTAEMTPDMSNYTEAGREGLKMLIKEDIKLTTSYYWTECSGPIEHYFEKYNGLKIPNVLASEILQRDNIELEEDKFHYIRKIGQEQIPVRKVIFGFPTKDVGAKVYKELIQMKDDVTGIKELEHWIPILEKSCIKESKVIQQKQISYQPEILAARSVIHKFLEMQEEDNKGFDVTYKLSHSLKNALDTLKTHLENDKDLDYFVKRSCNVLYIAGLKLYDDLSIIDIPFGDLRTIL